ncbi:hypothetical protein [Nostoc sp. PCC 7524]|nr:hypothetical protein [Nostoc sp. PCC 7524]
MCLLLAMRRDSAEAWQTDPLFSLPKFNNNTAATLHKQLIVT